MLYGHLISVDVEKDYCQNEQTKEYCVFLKKHPAKAFSGDCSFFAEDLEIDSLGKIVRCWRCKTVFKTIH